MESSSIFNDDAKFETEEGLGFEGREDDLVKFGCGGGTEILFCCGLAFFLVFFLTVTTVPGKLLELVPEEEFVVRF